MQFSKMTRDEVDFYLNKCNLTYDEEEVFKLLSRGKSRQQVSMELLMSDRTVDRRIFDIKHKIARCGGKLAK